MYKKIDVASISFGKNPNIFNFDILIDTSFNSSI